MIIKYKKVFKGVCPGKDRVQSKMGGRMVFCNRWSVKCRL